MQLLQEYDAIENTPLSFLGSEISSESHSVEVQSTSRTRQWTSNCARLSALGDSGNGFMFISILFSKKWFLSSSGNPRAGPKQCRQIHFCFRQQGGGSVGDMLGHIFEGVKDGEQPSGGKGWAFQGCWYGSPSHITFYLISPGREHLSLGSPRSWEQEPPLWSCCCLPSPHQRR